MHKLDKTQYMPNQLTGLPEISDDLTPFQPAHTHAGTWGSKGRQLLPCPDPKQYCATTTTAAAGRGVAPAPTPLLPPPWALASAPEGR